MTIADIKARINEHRNKFKAGAIFTTKYMNKDQVLINAITSHFNGNPNNFTLPEMIYLIENDAYDQSYCHRGKKKTFKGLTQGYTGGCGRNCACVIEATKIKAAETHANKTDEQRQETAKRKSKTHKETYVEGQKGLNVLTGSELNTAIEEVVNMLSNARRISNRNKMVATVRNSLKDIYPFANTVTEMIYLHLNGGTRPKCACGNDRTSFRSYFEGYTQFCGKTCPALSIRVTEGARNYYKNVTPEEMKVNAGKRVDSFKATYREKRVNAPIIQEEYIEEAIGRLVKKMNNRSKIDFNDIETISLRKTLQLRFPHMENLSEMLYLYCNGGARPVCVCGNQKTVFYGYHEGYAEFCGNNCSALSKRISERNSYIHANRTVEEKKLIRAKTEATNMERYGVSYPSSHPDIVNKAAETRSKRTVEELNAEREKFFETSMKNFGVPHPSQHPDVKQKNRDTHTERYGGMMVKAREVGYELYGGNPLSHPDIMKTTAETNMERYGVYKPRQRTITSELYATYIDDASFIKYVHEKGVYQSSVDFNVHVSSIYKKFKGLGETLPFVARSRQEVAIGNFLEVNNIKFVANDKILLGNNKELDFVLPDYNIAIEFCGMYWHSEFAATKPHNYHHEKWRLCKEKGIKLITIFEDEFDGREQVWFDFILGKCGLLPLSQITELRKFDGPCGFPLLNRIDNAATKYGIFSDDTLVGSFGLVQYEDDDFITITDLYSTGLNTLEVIRKTLGQEVILVLDNRMGPELDGSQIVEALKYPLSDSYTRDNVSDAVDYIWDCGRQYVVL